jgi:hypothetical protein
VEQQTKTKKKKKKKKRQDECGSLPAQRRRVPTKPLPAQCRCLFSALLKGRRPPGPRV